MKNNMHKNKIFIFFISLLTLVLVFIPLENSLASQSLEEINILTTPKKILFNVKDFKPGDHVVRTLKIKNNGNENFKYLASAKLTSGSEKLYEQLLLTITGVNGGIFSDKLSDFTKLEPRILKSSEEEELVFNIEFPKELGNEFQGLYSKVQFKFYVEGTLGGTIPVDGSKLPNTGTAMFNFVVAGAVLLIIGLSLEIYRRKKLKV
jgi:LPXTG-motif cell wall-anchored protein